MSRSNGASIDLPIKGISPLYAKFDFAKKSACDEIIRMFQEVIERTS